MIRIFSAVPGPLPLSWSGYTASQVARLQHSWIEILVNMSISTGAPPAGPAAGKQKPHLRRCAPPQVAKQEELAIDSPSRGGSRLPRTRGLLCFEDAIAADTAVL